MSEVLLFVWLHEFSPWWLSKCEVLLSSLWSQNGRNFSDNTPRRDFTHPIVHHGLVSNFLFNSLRVYSTEKFMLHTFQSHQFSVMAGLHCSLWAKTAILWKLQIQQKQSFHGTKYLHTLRTVQLDSCNVTHTHTHQCCS